MQCNIAHLEMVGPDLFLSWTLNLHIAIVLLRLTVHYSVEIKRYKSRIRIKMVNVVVALKVWGQLWANKCVEICCDNRAVVDVLSFGKDRDAVLVTCARNVWLLSAMYNITVVVSHVKGTNNVVVDLFS